MPYAPRCHRHLGKEGAALSESEQSDDDLPWASVAGGGGARWLRGWCVTGSSASSRRLRLALPSRSLHGGVSSKWSLLNYQRFLTSISRWEFLKADLRPRFGGVFSVRRSLVVFGRQAFLLQRVLVEQHCEPPVVLHRKWES